MRRRGLALPLTIGVVLIALLLALATWQLQRRVWKLALIAQVERHLRAAPGPAPLNATPVDAYRRVRLHGHYLHDREVRVQALTERGAGFWIVTPLQTVGGPVLINRGFAPADRIAAASRPAGARTVTGLLRLTEPGGGFLRTNDPARDRWYSRDVGAIARAKGLGRAAPYFVDAAAAGEAYPIGGLTVIAFRNNHLIYALTWFALAGLTGWALARLMRMRGERSG
jgi:surfeit locus 1 family protein